MRIMILVPGLPANLEAIKGGAVAAVANLVHGFAQCPDVSLKVVSMDHEKPEHDLQQPYPNVSIQYLQEGKYPYHSLNYLVYGPALLQKMVDEFKPDIIHFEAGNTFHFIKRGVKTHAKYVLTIHGMAREEAKRKKHWKDKLTWYFNAMTQEKTFPKNVVHLSQFSIKLFGSKIKNNTIIPNAIRETFFTVPAKKMFEHRLLYIGVIDHNKNLPYLLDELAFLKKKGIQYSVDVLGDFLSEEFRTEIKQKIISLEIQDQVRFQGWVTQEQVQQFLADADILVVSSKHESLPMVIAESMAAGKLVIASAVGGIPEMIQHNETGYLFSLQGDHELAQRLTDLYDKPEQVMNMAAKAREYAMMHYQARAVAEKTIQFYKTCI